MKGLERVKEWLRPFVDSKVWDYCVVWKLGDDPSRFIEWVGCCCNGGCNDNNNGVQDHRLCRDEHNHHFIRSKTCEDLDRFPFFMNLYSGIHGDVVISKQPRWMNQSFGLDSKPPTEPMGTRALIPVFGGLIELCSSKIIPKDEKIIELITTHCNISLEQEVKSTTNNLYGHQLFDDMLEQNLPLLLQLSKTTTPRPEFPNTNHPSSSGSNPSNEHHNYRSFHSSPSYVSPTGEFVSFVGTESLVKKENNGLVDVRSNHDVKEKAGEKKENYHSKNLVTERNRRNRINKGLLTLRSMVPNISKMDKASILKDAADYICELSGEVKRLQDELREIEEEENKARKFTKPDRETERATSSTDQLQEKAMLKVEVNQIGKQEFAIKILCKHRLGGFTWLMEVMDSLGLQVIDANVTMYSGESLNNLNVKANQDDIEAKKLEEMLFELTR